MYMREMGSVELLTREGEIEIAKRIEDGLKHMIQAISACPTTIAEILALADRIGKDEIKIDEVVDGFMSTNEARRRRRRRRRRRVDEEDDDDGAGGSKALTKKLEQLKVAGAGQVRRDPHALRQDAQAFEKEGHRAPSYDKAQKKITDELMKIRFTARPSSACATACAARWTTSASYERKIQDRREQGRHAAAHFIKTFPRNETNLRWVENEIAAQSSVQRASARATAGHPSSSRSCSTCRRA